MPEVKTFLDKSRELMETKLFNMPEGMVPNPPPEEVESPVLEEEVQEPVVDEQPPAKEETPEEKEFKNPHAYIRRLERDRSVLEERSSKLLELVEQLSKTERKEAEASAAVAEETGKAPDPDTDPFGAVFYQLNKLQQQINGMSKKEETVEVEEKFKQAVVTADRMVQEVAKEDPDQYGAALVHLGKIVLENIADENPSLTEKQILQLAEVTIIKKKLDWLSSGKNPGIEFLRLARRYGFKWEGKRAEGEAPTKKEQKVAVDARKLVQQEKAQESKTRTIKPGGGVAPQSGKDLRRMDATDFQRYVIEKQKAGQMTGRAGNVPLREVLAGKELR